jgi:hypothetical protein
MLRLREMRLHARGARWRQFHGGGVFAPDARDEAVAPTRDIDDEAAACSVVSQRTADRRDVGAQIGPVDEGLRPSRRHQFILADHVPRAIDQRQKQIECATANIDRCARRDQLALLAQQLEGIKRQLLIGNGFHGFNIALRQKRRRTSPGGVFNSRQILSGHEFVVAGRNHFSTAESLAATRQHTNSYGFTSLHSRVSGRQATIPVSGGVSPSRSESGDWR